MPVKKIVLIGHEKPSVPDIQKWLGTALKMTVEHTNLKEDDWELVDPEVRGQTRIEIHVTKDTDTSVFESKFSATMFSAHIKFVVIEDTAEGT